MPVRNGQRFIREALDSLLGQSFEDFEIVISDNASTDRTETICREYASRDPRVRYHRNHRDIGPAPNYNATFDRSRGQYFKWSAHDDVLEKQYLEKCVSALDADDSAVLTYPRTRIIDESGNEIEDYDYKLATDSPDPVRRFAELVLVNHRRHRAVEIFGLMRSAALHKTPLQGSYARGDSVLLVRLALLGRFVEVPERLFLSRCHASQSMQTLPTTARTGGSRLARFLGTGPLPPPEWWDNTRRGRVSFPEWNLLREYWRSIERSGLSWVDRTRCRMVMMEWAAWNVPKLIRDALFAAEHVVNRVSRTKETAPGAHVT